MEWEGDVLEISPTADLNPLLEAIYDDIPAPRVANRAILGEIEKLTAVQKQRLIRRYGLDGNQPKAIGVIARESKRSRTAVELSLSRSLHRLRMFVIKMA